jgi:hypothetical protein
MLRHALASKTPLEEVGQQARSEAHRDGRETTWQALPPLTILNLDTSFLTETEN